MESKDFSSLIVAKYEIKLKPSGFCRLPIFLGSTLRGALGHSLKKTVCIVNHGNCERCIVADKCVYPYLFESTIVHNASQKNKQIPHPFVLSSPFAQGSRPGEYRQFNLTDELVFELLLMGKTTDYLPYIIYAISQMAERGFGLTNHASFQLEEVNYLAGDNKISLYDKKIERIKSVSTVKTLADLIETRQSQLKDINSQNTTLEFITPTRIRVEDDLQAKLDFSLIIRNLLRRVSMLSEFYGQEKWKQDFSQLVRLAEEVKTESSQLGWWDFERYSNRQRTRMKLGGVIGKVRYQGSAIAEFLPLLIAGEFLHIGNGTSFGLGKYRVIP